MRIGFIGAGHIGSTLARRFAEAGHEVLISNSRGPETLSEIAAELGEHGRAVTTMEAASLGDVIIVAVPLHAYRDVPAAPLAGKLVIDANNYYAGRDGHIEELDTDRTTSSELLAERLGGDVRLVKAFNAIEWTRLRDRGREAGDPERLAIPISGDDAEAKRTVAGLIDQIGFDTVDMGSLAAGGRTHQPGMPAYGADLPAEELRSHAAAG